MSTAPGPTTGTASTRRAVTAGLAPELHAGRPYRPDALDGPDPAASRPTTVVENTRRDRVVRAPNARIAIHINPRPKAPPWPSRS